MTAHMMMLEGMKARVGYLSMDFNLQWQSALNDSSHIFNRPPEDYLKLILGILQYRHVGVIMNNCNISGSLSCIQ